MRLVSRSPAITSPTSAAKEPNDLIVEGQVPFNILQIEDNGPGGDALHTEGVRPVGDADDVEVSPDDRRGVEGQDERPIVGVELRHDVEVSELKLGVPGSVQVSMTGGSIGEITISGLKRP